METVYCIHIVPALPPQISRVGDYALKLAFHLQQSFGVQSRFIVCDPEWNGPSRVEGFVVRRMRLRSEAGIWGLLASSKEKDATVLLHYNGNGYDKLGVPLWLYRGIKSWLDEQTERSAASQGRLCTVFHDLWASPNQPWKIEYYLRKLQISLVKGFHLRSKVSVTNTRRMRQALEDFEPRKTLWLPTPSNLPVTDRSKGRSRRNGRVRAILLGDSDSRTATVKAHANLLRTLEAKGRLARAILLETEKNNAGAPTEDERLLRQCVSSERIEVLGQLNPVDASRHLAESDLFLSHCCGEIAYESSTFMAALAARCPAVLRHEANTVPLQEIKHFMSSDDSHLSVRRIEEIVADGRLDQIASAGRLWYERYADWNAIARKYHEAICHQASFEGAPLISPERPNQLELRLHAAQACANQAV
jgi:hypothetical protein